MSSLAKNLKTLAAVMGFAAAGVATGAQAAPGAQAATTCGLTGVRADQTTVYYDPFEASAPTTALVNMTITRDNLEKGAKTSILNFYLKPSSTTGSAANGIEIYPISISGQAQLYGTELDIFYGTNENPPVTLLPIDLMPSEAIKFAKISFTGNNEGSDAVDVVFRVELPANLNLEATQELTFDAFFGCNIQGSQLTGSTHEDLRTGAMRFPVVVLSALRTYFAGTALDFGDITLITTDFATKNTGEDNYVYVQSSGAYDITLSSEKGFVMENTNGVTGDNDKIKYSLDFLGTTVSSGTHPTPGDIAIAKDCKRAGLASESKQLPIKATLMEAGAGHNSGIYLDTLTVTLTPKAYEEEGMVECGV